MTKSESDLFMRLCEAFWDLQFDHDCWCDTGEGNPHTPACLAARKVTADAQRAYDTIFARNRPAARMIREAGK